MRSEPVEGIDYGIVTESDMAMARLAAVGGGVETDFSEFYIDDDDDLICHCGEPVTFGYDGDPERHRGMCAHCDPIRCDAYPGECHR